MREDCVKCGGDLPELDGDEENDFATVCKECQAIEDSEDLASDDMRHAGEDPKNG